MSGLSFFDSAVQTHLEKPADKSELEKGEKDKEEDNDVFDSFSAGISKKSE